MRFIVIGGVVNRCGFGPGSNFLKVGAYESPTAGEQLPAEKRSVRRRKILKQA